MPFKAASEVCKMRPGVRRQIFGSTSVNSPFGLIPFLLGTVTTSGILNETYAWKICGYPPKYRTRPRTKSIQPPFRFPVCALRAHIFRLGYPSCFERRKKHPNQFSRLPLRGFTTNPLSQPPSRVRLIASTINGS